MVFSQKNRYIILIIFIGLVIRLINLNTYSVWLDEKTSVSEANSLIVFNFDSVFTLREIQNNDTLINVFRSVKIADAGNGITYIVLLHYWKEFFGNTDFAIRFLSLLFGVIAIFLTYRLSFVITKSKKISHISGLLSSLHPFLITYSQEARAYMLCVVFVLSASIILFKTLKSKNFNFSNHFSYSIFILLAFFTHYSSIYIIFAHLLIFLFIKTVIPKWKSITSVLILFGLTIFIWFYFYGFDCYELISLRSDNYKTLSFNDPKNPLYMSTSFYSVFAGWVQNILMFSGNTLSSYGLLLRYNSIFLVFVLIILVPILKRKDGGLKTYIYCLSFLSFSALLYATFLAVISGHIISFQNNYSIFSLPFFIIMISVSLSFYKSFFKNKIYLFSVFLFLLVLTSSNIGILFGLDSHNKSLNTFEVCAEKINSFYKASFNKSIKISYGSKACAIELNKYLNSSLADVRQSVNDEIEDNEVVLYKSSLPDTIYVFKLVN
tara:strand:- start:849 stop:2327 length:1479 start_codon:yes stop_codon:yes gene_type:complete